jgi:phosphate acetyltransferase
MATELIENHPFGEIQEGQSAEIERTLTRDDIAMFGKVSGDLNPTHFGQELSAGIRGGITGDSLSSSALISSLLGNVLPGPGAVYRRQYFEFERQIVLGARVPIILTSRSDTPRRPRASVAVMHAHALRDKAVAGAM